MKKLIYPLFIAFILWFWMFCPLTASMFDFWFMMSLAAAVLIFISFFEDGKELLHAIRFSWKDIGIGIASAAVLWGFFWLGNFISTRIFPFAAGQIGNVYALKNDAPPAVIAGLLLFLIGPAEEIFWHGFIQTNIAKICKTTSNIHHFIFTVGITTLIYSLIHLPSLNFMLIMAAMVCGLFWSILYYFNKNLLTVIISHALWDCAVFILFPIS